MARGLFITGFTVAEVRAIQQRAKELSLEGKTIMNWNDADTSVSKQFAMIVAEVLDECGQADGSNSWDKGVAIIGQRVVRQGEFPDAARAFVTETVELMEVEQLVLDLKWVHEELMTAIRGDQAVGTGRDLPQTVDGVEERVFQDTVFNLCANSLDWTARKLDPFMPGRQGLRRARCSSWERPLNQCDRR